MNAMKMVPAILVVLAAVVAADPKVEISAGTRGKNQVIVVRGTGFADGNVEMALLYVRKYPVPPALRGPDDPEFDEELIDVDMGRVDIADGNFEAFMDYADTPAWVGDYRVILTVDGERKSFDGRIGAATDFTAQRLRADRELYSELARFEALRREFLEHWNGLGADADAGWPDWKKDAERRLNVIRDRNGRRRKSGVYFCEYQGRDKIQKLLQGFSSLLSEANGVMTSAKAARPAAAGPQETLLDFESAFEAYLDYFGFDRIVDNAGVSRGVEAVRALRDEIGAFRARLPIEAAAWKDAMPDLRVRQMEAQVALSELLPEALFGRCDAMQKALQRSLDHAKALASGAAPAKPWEDCVKEFDEAAQSLLKGLPVADEGE